MLLLVEGRQVSLWRRDETRRDETRRDETSANARTEGHVGHTEKEAIMPDTQLDVAALPSTGHKLQYSAVTVSASASNLAALAPYMFWLMFRNVASDGLAFETPPDSNNQPSPPRSCRYPDAYLPHRRGRTPART